MVVAQVLIVTFTCNGHCLRAQQPIRELIVAENTCEFAVAPDAKTFATGDTFGKIHFWDLQTGKVARTSSKTGLMSDCLRYSVTGKLLAIATHDQLPLIWSLEGGDEPRPLERLQLGGAGPSTPPMLIVFSPDSKFVAATVNRGHISKAYGSFCSIWDVSTGKVTMKSGKHGGWIYCLCFSPDGKSVATGSRDGSVAFWDASSGQLLKVLNKDAGPEGFRDLAFSPDGKTLATFSDFRMSEGKVVSGVRLWNLETGEEKSRLIGCEPPVRYSPDGAIFTSSLGGKLTIHDAVSGKPLANLRASPNRNVESVTFCDDGKLIVTYDGYTVKVWRTREVLPPTPPR